MGFKECSNQEINIFLQKKYYIPNYQRDYSWENDELDDFWSDLISCNETNSEHFFGQIVIHEEKIKDSDKTIKYIIDGQQRTITTMIFLKVLKEKVEELYKEKTDDSVLKLLFSISQVIGDEEEGIHLTLGENDRDFFNMLILNGEALSNINPVKKYS